MYIWVSTYYNGGLGALPPEAEVFQPHNYVRAPSHNVGIFTVRILKPALVTFASIKLPFGFGFIFLERELEREGVRALRGGLQQVLGGLRETVKMVALRFPGGLENRICF